VALVVVEDPNDVPVRTGFVEAEYVRSGIQNCVRYLDCLIDSENRFLVPFARFTIGATGSASGARKPTAF
jgi:hypothetical protein